MENKKCDKPGGTKRVPVNISSSSELLAAFDAAVKHDGVTRSWVIRETMRAYLELSERCKANGIKSLPRLEFKGCEDDLIRRTSPSSARSWPVAGRAFKCKTGKTEKVK